jgi:hypothetical protein
VREAGVVAAAVGVDAQRWKFSRVQVLEREPSGSEQGTAYQVLYLARPLLRELPKVEARKLEFAKA